ncbi:MAG: phenylalanine--tRNA ligase subunit beta [Clostridia bacterium]|nr:phenylalanine--tRNA ligase subunit beta [Clostridia bacterium]
MLAPISWLKDYVDINVSPSVLAKKLVAIGFEVEDIIYQEKQVSNVVVGKIVQVEKHPNADRLRVTQIDIGGKTLQVVTNVPVVGGEVVALSLDGARLANGLEIKTGELRGVKSEGMLCGLEELGLTVDSVEGQDEKDIIRFNDGTPLGENALVALGYNDVILDVSITANRPDCNGIFKLAKEVAVALGTECREPKINYKSVGGNVNDDVSVEVKNQALCPRYMAASVKNVKIFPSSQTIKSRLLAVGIRPINNIVDITNYVLTEIGQPMHAFDKRELGGNKIVVRNAKEDEIIVSLDGKENHLKEDMLVICDAEKPCAVAGIMGGLNSGIKDDTSEIVFESAKFARDSVRRTSRALNLRSDSSARFEKGIDFGSQELGLKRALTLIYETGSGDIQDGIIDVKVDYQKTREIEFTTRKIADILGCKVPKAKLVEILNKLGIEVKDNGKSLVAVIGEDRDDIVGVNDLAEEFIRVYGYGHVKPTLFEYSALTEGSKPSKIKFVDKVKNTMVACGLDEAVTYSFISAKFAEDLRLTDDDAARNAVKIMNPLGEALSVMRTSLTHSMLETLAYNKTHFVKQAKLFEVSKVYIPKSLPLEELPSEVETLSIGMYGEGIDFFFAKHAVEELMRALGKNAEYVRSTRPFLHPGRSAEVLLYGKSVGYVGEVHPDVQETYGIDNFRVYIAEINLDEVYDEAEFETRRKVQPFSKFPTVDRDLAVVVDDKYLAGDLLGAVKAAKIKYLTDMRVFDTYKSEQIGEGKKSVAMSFSFACLERTLTDEDVNAEMAKILSALKRKVGAKIR